MSPDDLDALAAAVRIHQGLCAARGWPQRPALDEFRTDVLRRIEVFDKSRHTGDPNCTMGRDAKRFFTCAEFADRVGKHERTIQRWVAAGKLHANARAYHDPNLIG